MTHRPRQRTTTAAGFLTLAFVAAACASTRTALPDARAAEVEASAAAALEGSQPIRSSVAADDADAVVHCATTYLDADAVDRPGGHVYVWAMCEHLLAGREAGAVSEAVRLTVRQVEPPRLADPQALPDDATPEDVEQIFPGHFSTLTAHPGNGVVDTLQARLVARRGER